MEIAGIIKNSFVDFPKLISCVVFTAGCNMNCWYCHNRDIIPIQKGVVQEEKFFEFLKSRVGFLDGVVISGGEPTLQNDLAQFAKKIKQMGFSVKLDTNGTNTEIINKLVDSKLIDYIAMDIKAPLIKYEKVTFVEDRQVVQNSIEYIKSCGVEYEFRTTFAPNLSKNDIIEILKMIKGANRYSLQAYIKPDYIKEGVFKNHSTDVFYELQKIGYSYVNEFNIKNINYAENKIMSDSKYA